MWCRVICNLASWTHQVCDDVVIIIMIDESAKTIEPTTQDSQKKVALVWSSLLAGDSYTMPFVIVSRTIGVFFVMKEPSHRSWLQANYAISPEQNIFSEVHAVHIFKGRRETVCRLTLDTQTRCVAASVVTHTHTHTHPPTHTHTHDCKARPN